MKEKICIITDSCADIPDSYLEKYDIRMVHMNIQSSSHTYRDRVDIQVSDVYKLLETELLRSASPTGEDMIQTLEKVAADGYTHAVAILLSSALSGSYNAFRLWKDTVDGLDVEVFDSLNGSIGCGIIAIQAAIYRNQGKSFNEICDNIPRLIENTYVYFSIEHLDLLEKGGRIGKAASLLGGIMKIHPILSFAKDGELYSPAKVRGKNKIVSKLSSLVQKNMVGNENRHFNLMIADGNAKDELDLMRQQMKEMFPNFDNFIETEIGATLSCYIGDQVVGAGIQFLDR